MRGEKENPGFTIGWSPDHCEPDSEPPKRINCVYNPKSSLTTLYRFILYLGQNGTCKYKPKTPVLI